ncbi:hypothetical protein CY34DRAFT_408006 [Suillus luteus UH-Slu-Lm8-n1]|uniref:Uncharacterized protein n=1 Tax=Suillus luteus UH-Slu-Lm8-n1 TaxID=930992 RepID=A0A0D0B2E2_9AGAM|nr:hypothetical protein CY34DRAFT_408006 [Suillus luteus UH-Slu-Lm8-n1]
MNIRLFRQSHVRTITTVIRWSGESRSCPTYVVLPRDHPVGAVIAIWRNPVNHSIYAITTFIQFRADSLKRTQLTRRSPPLNDSTDTGCLVTTSCLSIWNSFWYGYRVCVVIR